MLAGVVDLLTCQVVGEFVVRLTGLPVPGAVVGMLMFLGQCSGCGSRRRIPD